MKQKQKRLNWLLGEKCIDILEYGEIERIKVTTGKSEINQNYNKKYQQLSNFNQNSICHPQFPQQQDLHLATLTLLFFNYMTMW